MDDESNEPHEMNRSFPGDRDDEQGDRPSSDSGARANWRIIVLRRWQVLGQEIMGLGSSERLNLRDISRECEVLASVVAWYEHDGNITHAARDLNVSRRSLRERIASWREEHPELEPRAGAELA